MVEDLLRSLSGAELDTDYGTLEKLPAEYVGDGTRPSGRVGSLLRKLRSTTAIGMAGVPAVAAPRRA